MNRLIQPLSDILRQYPDISAGAIVIISFILSVLATAYVALQEQAKSVLKEKFEAQKYRDETCVNNRDKMSEQVEKIKELVESNRQLTLNLGESYEEIDELKRENFDLETKQKLAKIQENLTKMITANQDDVEDITKAISTQEDRMKAFREARKEQKKKTNVFNRFKMLFRQDKD